jgi:hypothetical protein
MLTPGRFTPMPTLTWAEAALSAPQANSSARMGRRMVVSCGSLDHVKASTRRVVDAVGEAPVRL